MLKQLSKKNMFRSAFLQIRFWLPSMFLLLSGAALLTISYAKPAILSSMRIAVIDASQPLISAINAPLHKISQITQNAKELWQLRAINQSLRADNQALLAWQQKARSLQSDNQQLRALLNVQGNALYSEHNVITTQVLNDTSTDFAKSILIKAGRKQGIDNHAVIVAPQGLVGRVIETADNTARVLLISDINARIPVLLHKDDIVQHAIMNGQNHKAPVISYLKNPKDLTAPKALEGAHIMTSGAGGLYPYGIPVGTLAVQENGSMHVNTFAQKGRVFYVSALLHKNKRGKITPP